MNNEFTRMQKLAGVPVTEAVQADNTPEVITEGMDKKKMTKSEAKKMIKDAILAEMSHDDDPRDPHADPHNLPGGQYLDEATTDAIERMESLVNQNHLSMMFRAASGIINSLKEEDFDEEDIHDYLVYLITTLDDSGLMEAKKDEEAEDVETEETEEETIEEPADDNVDMDMEGDLDLDAGSDEAKNAFDELTDAYRSAKELGDEKLVRQLANTITYFNKNIILK